MNFLQFFSTQLAAVIVAVAAAPWHLDGWQERAVVTIARPADDRDCDTAAVKVLSQGHARPDGADYRVLDGQGRPLPFQIMFHDATRYSLISFRASDPSETYFIYYGNPQAARSAEEIVADPRPAAGPPNGVWTPRYGLVYVTMRRPEGDNPKTVDEFAAMLAASPSKDGARYQRRIADGFNPFGSSDNYLSVYRGWLRIDAAGRYRFCTASNEASFSFLGGKELVHWPGRHTAERGIHGEKNAAVELTTGWHYVEYYHEEVALQQMAFLGWSPPGAPQERFDAIPEAAFPAPHQGIAAYESRSESEVRFEPAIVDTIWPRSRQEGQFTRVKFSVAGHWPGVENKDDVSAPTYRWDFGDGQTGSGREVEHVYLTLGTYPVKLTEDTADGSHTAEWPLTVYEVQHVTDLIHEGNLADYARVASNYDRMRLDAAALKELAYLLAEADQPQAAFDAASEFAERFAGEKPAWASAMRRLMAEMSLKLGKAKLDDAIANYLASLTDQTPPEERFDVLARLIRLLGIEQDQPERAGEIFKQAEAAAKPSRLNETARAAFRECVIATGDVRLWHAERDEARSLYRRAEALAAQPTAPQVRAAQIGAYPNMIREFIDSGDLGAALNIVDRWERSFPTEKLAGQTFFWRGKLLALRGQHHEAARYLARAVGLAPGAAFESEARWLLASSLKQLGRLEDARRELAKLVAAGFADEFAEKARKELASSTSDK
ncbi:MAG TPA: PKD domain-containing protein [Pirellulales bacterium]|nr:PKD domain-containing protein [Pirellulales bacterium]